MTTRMSPLGGITLTPIPGGIGRSADLGSTSIVYFIKRSASRAFNSFRVKCLHERKKTANNAEMLRIQSKDFFYLLSHIETPPPNGMVWFATGFRFS